MLLTEKYVDQISAVITCYDRIVIQGVIPRWRFANGMTGYFHANKIKIFDYATFSQPLTQKVRDNAERIAQENGIEIKFIRKLKAFRKDDRVQEIIRKTEGLVHIFSAMECCNTYKPRHDKATGKTFLKPDKSKCLHYYFLSKNGCFFRSLLLYRTACGSNWLLHRQGTWTVLSACSDLGSLPSAVLYERT